MKIIVYSTKICPNCKMLKELLASKNVPFKEMEMGTPAALTELSIHGVFTMMAPVLQIENAFYYKDIIEAGKLNVSKVSDILKSHKIIS